MKKQYSMLVRLLLGFLFVINARGHSSATDILGQKENQKELEATRISSTFTEKETPDGRKAHQYHVRKLGFGGKKSMVIHNKESNMEFSVKEENGSSEEGGERRRTSKISGATYSDGICDFEREGDINVKCKVLDHRKTEKDDALNKSKERSREGDDQKEEDQSITGNLSKSTNSNYSQISEESHQAHDEGTNDNTPKDEEKAGVEEEEVTNFVHMDYKGMARRKPPINNNEPRN